MILPLTQNSSVTVADTDVSSAHWHIIVRFALDHRNPELVMSEDVFIASLLMAEVFAWERELSAQLKSGLAGSKPKAQIAQLMGQIDRHMLALGCRFASC